MTLNLCRRSALFASAVLFALLTFIPAFAELKIVQIDAPKVRLSISPGETKAGTIQISNSSSEDKEIKVYLEDWLYLPVCDGTKEFKPAGTIALSAANWISFAPAEIQVPAYGKAALNYTVKVPADAQGGHYAVLFFEDYMGGQKAGAEGVNVNLAIRVGALFYVEPQGTINRSVKIENLKITKKENKYDLSIDFSNTGNVDVTAKSAFFMIDSGGMPYARGELSPVYSFPGGTATLSGTWNQALPKGNYDLVLTIDIGKATEEAGWGRGPVITKESEIEIGENGEVIRVGELK